VVVDLVGACAAFVHVSERGSFTVGAAAAGMPQSVASRRIAALEKHLGEDLFDRSSRRATLTPFGRELLPSAKRLVSLAEAIQDDADRARRRPFRLAVPGTCGVRSLSQLAVDAREHGLHLEFCPAGPRERIELVRSGEVRAALAGVPSGEGLWSVPLGLAGLEPSSVSVIFLESLRAGRMRTSAPRRIWIQPEDDVPHTRDRITRVQDAVGLAPSQVRVAASLTAAVAEVLGSGDLLLCDQGQADDLGLVWRPIGELTLLRSFDVTAGTGSDGERIRTRLRTAIARCLGAGQ
jgi:DNA-binding transcriptional LysR family regulator